LRRTPGRFIINLTEACNFRDSFGSFGYLKIEFLHLTGLCNPNPACLRSPFKILLHNFYESLILNAHAGICMKTFCFYENDSRHIFEEDCFFKVQMLTVVIKRFFIDIKSEGT